MFSEKEFVLDAEAEKLYQLLGGIETRSQGLTSLEPKPEPEYDTDGFLDSINREEEIVEVVRVLLIEVTYYLAAFFKGARVSGPEEFWRESVDKIGAVIGRLAEIPGRATDLVLRFRGNSVPGEEAGYDQFDYTMAMGDYSIDLAVAKSLSKQQGLKASHLPGRLRKAFKSFGGLEISSVSVTIGAWKGNDRQLVTDSLQGLVTFYQALADTDGGAGNVVYDENRQPDPNLTVLGLINRVKVPSLQQLVGQVDEMMYSEKPTPSLQQCLSVYDAIFKFKKFRDQLQKPAVEVNSVRWLMDKRGQEAVPRDKVEIFHTLAKVFSKSPRRIAEIVESVNGSDYQDISVENLSGNLRKLTEFIYSLEKEKSLVPTKEKVLRTVNSCLDQVGDEVFDDFRMPARNILHDDLFGLVTSYKHRVSTRRKVQRIISEQIDFNSHDMLILARDLGIVSNKARQLVVVLQACFTVDGHFNRRDFESNIEVFLTSEKKIFAFLWHYFKVIRGRNDRIPFLNSMQLLISKMQRPQNSLETLLRDVVGDPDTVQFSDRNALILVNLLIRDYNKELHKHIELTPEEVLLVKEGLNLELTAGAGAYIDQEADKFLRKIKTLHKQILNALADRWGKSKPMTLHYVVSVEREMFILLALIGGRRSHNMIQSAVREYGDPDSKVYALVTDQGQMKAVLGLLQLVVRGLGRFKDYEDIKLLQQVRSQKAEFQARFGDLLPRVAFNKVIIFTEKSMATILAAT